MVRATHCFTRAPSSEASSHQGAMGWGGAPVAQPVRFLPADRRKCITRTIEQDGAIIVGYPFIARNPQESRGEMERDACADMREGIVAIRKVAGVLPQEVPDERFGCPTRTPVAEEGMLQLPGNPPDVV